MYPNIYLKLCVKVLILYFFIYLFIFLINGIIKDYNYFKNYLFLIQSYIDYW